MNFSIETVYNKERLLKFNTFVFLRRKFIWIALLLLDVLISVSFFVSFAIGELSKNDWLYFIAILCCSALYFFYRLVLPRFIINKNPQLNSVLKYDFFDSYMVISSPSDSFSKSPEVSYDLISKAFIYKKDLYLYFSPTKCFILDTLSFEKEDLTNFTNFLKSKNLF